MTRGGRGGVEGREDEMRREKEEGEREGGGEEEAFWPFFSLEFFFPLHHSLCSFSRNGKAFSVSLVPFDVLHLKLRDSSASFHLPA